MKTVHIININLINDRYYMYYYFTDHIKFSEKYKHIFNLVLTDFNIINMYLKSVPMIYLVSHIGPDKLSRDI